MCAQTNPSDAKNALLDRCRQTNGQLAVAYVDVVALETLSGSASAGASEELLKRVVAAIGDQLRTFDLIIRLGDDGFRARCPT